MSDGRDKICVCGTQSGFVAALSVGGDGVQFSLQSVLAQIAGLKEALEILAAEGESAQRHAASVCTQYPGGMVGRAGAFLQPAGGMPGSCESTIAALSPGRRPSSRSAPAARERRPENGVKPTVRKRGAGVASRAQRKFDIRATVRQFQSVPPLEKSHHLLVARFDYEAAASPLLDGNSWAVALSVLSSQDEVVTRYAIFFHFHFHITPPRRCAVGCTHAYITLWYIPLGLFSFFPSFFRIGRAILYGALNTSDKIGLARKRSASEAHQECERRTAPNDGGRGQPTSGLRS